MKIEYIFLPLFLFLFLSCNGKGKSLTEVGQGNMKEYEESNVNPIEQAKPEIMVLPSDHNLKEEGALKRVSLNGEWFTLRDYSKYLLQAPDFKEICAFIQQGFLSRDFPLTDFDQTLKSLDSGNAFDMADNLTQDAKTRLLSTARPDIILELDYDVSSDVTKSKAEKKGKYILNAIDPYTNKVVASISSNNLTGTSMSGLILNDLDKQLPDLMDELQNYFANIVTKGREVTVTVNVDASSLNNLADNSRLGGSYADAIIDYIKIHTVKGAYKLQSNSANRLAFTNVRIKVLNEDGTQYGVYDWARELQNYLSNTVGLNTVNNSQGLGDIILTISN